MKRPRVAPIHHKEWPREQDELDLCWQTFDAAQCWGELDWSDTVRIYILPPLWRAVCANPAKYPLSFVQALVKARHREYPDWQPLLRFFDKAVKRNRAGTSFAAWADQHYQIFKEMRQ